jgi:hypothetical protein
MVSVGSNRRSAPAAVVWPVFAMSVWEYECPGPMQPESASGIRVPVWSTQPAGAAATGRPTLREGAFPVEAQPTIPHAAPSAIHLVI